MSKIRILLLLAVLSLGTVSAASFLHPAVAASGKYFDHSVTILMENNDLQSVLSQGTYQASLSSQYTLSTGYSAVSHPSEPNYVALLGGSTNGINNDGICCFTVNAPNLVDRFEGAGLTWKAFAEDASGSGTCSFSPPRGGDHFGFLDYADMNAAARCANFVSTSSPGDSEFVSYLNSAAPANYIWLTPNDNDNSHDTPISTGDAYLAALVPQILSSNLFKSQRAALFIVYDEGNDASCSGGGSDCIYASWSGPVAKKGFTSSNAYTHYSYVHTMEDNWALSTLTSNDVNAPVMAEFFGPSGPVPLSTSFIISPSSVAQVHQPMTFTANPSGGTSPYTETWNFGDGSSGSGATATHSYSSAGTFQVSLTTKDSASTQATATSTHSVVISAPPPPGAVSVSISSNPTNANTGQNLAFSATVTGGTPPYGIGWDFGDGTIGVGTSTTHAFSGPGRFNVTAAVTDSGTPARSAAASIFITVSQAPPPPSSLTADFTLTPSSLNTGDTVTFASSVSGGSPSYTYAWDFGDSSGTSTVANPRYSYTSAGTFTVRLSVTDSAAATITASHTLTVSSPVVLPPPPASGTSGSYCNGLTPQGLQPTVSVDYVNPGNSASSSSTALFDTGANYSLAPASLATALGLTLTDGTPVMITDLGGAPFQAYLFNLNLNIGGSLQVVNVPVAISTSATQFLIGRQGFLNQVSVSIDSSTLTACFTASAPPSSSCDTEESTCGGAADGDGDGDGDHQGAEDSSEEDSGDTGDSGDATSGLFTGTSGTVSGLPMILTIIPLMGLVAVASKGLASRVRARPGKK